MRLAVTTRVRGKPREQEVDPAPARIKDFVCVDCHRLLPTRDQNSRRVGRAQVSIVPDARIRVRLARQVPRPIMIPGSQPLCLIMVIMCTPPWKICIQSHCSQTRSRHQRRSSRRDRDPGELALPPRCTHHLTEANFVSGGSSEEQRPLARPSQALHTAAVRQSVRVSPAAHRQ